MELIDGGTSINHPFDPMIFQDPVKKTSILIGDPIAVLDAPGVSDVLLGEITVFFAFSSHKTL